MEQYGAAQRSSAGEHQLGGGAKLEDIAGVGQAGVHLKRCH